MSTCVIRTENLCRDLCVRAVCWDVWHDAAIMSWCIWAASNGHFMCRHSSLKLVWSLVAEWLGWVSHGHEMYCPWSRDHGFKPWSGLTRGCTVLLSKSDQPKGKLRCGNTKLTINSQIYNLKQISDADWNLHDYNGCRAVQYIKNSASADTTLCQHFCMITLSCSLHVHELDHQN